MVVAANTIVEINKSLVSIWMRIHELQAQISSIKDRLELLENEDKLLWYQIEKLKKEVK